MKKLLALSLVTIGLAIATPSMAAKKDKKNKAKTSAGKSSKDEKKGDKKKKKGDGPSAHASVNAAPKVKEAAVEQPVDVRLDVQRAQLDNGLKIVLAPDHAAATIAVSVTYDVGSRNEDQGHTGFAHLFEHMMFEGSKNVPRTEHFKLISAHGGVLNGTTNRDRTNYYETLPSNELALALWLEADRMKSLDVSQSNFENQRKVVEEEFRMRYLNVPYKLSQFRLEELVYQGFFPYEHSTIGKMEDLDGAKLEWVQDFHGHHYGPNNAVLSISGDFEPAEALALVHKYFDGAQKIEATPFGEAPFPEQTSQRTANMKDELATTSGIMYGWAVPPMHAADHYALELVADILAGGESSRLHETLVRDKALALATSAWVDGRRGPDLFEVQVKATPSNKVREIEKTIEDQIAQLATRGPTDAEIQKAHRRAESDFVFGLSTNLGRAIKLGEFETYFGDARELNAELPKYFAVTKEDVKRVASQYLGPTRRTIVETAAPGGEEAKVEPKPRSSGDAKPAKKGDKKKDDAKKSDKKKDDGKAAKKKKS